MLIWHAQLQRLDFTEPYSYSAMLSDWQRRRHRNLPPASPRRRWRSGAAKTPKLAATVVMRKPHVYNRMGSPFRVLLKRLASSARRDGDGWEQDEPHYGKCRHEKAFRRAIWIIGIVAGSLGRRLPQCIASMAGVSYARILWSAWGRLQVGRGPGRNETMGQFETKERNQPIRSNRQLARQLMADPAVAPKPKARPPVDVSYHFVLSSTKN